MKKEFEEKGYVTLPFPSELKKEMHHYIMDYLQGLVDTSLEDKSLEQFVKTIPEPVWQLKMRRSFRIFPSPLASRVLDWAHHTLCSVFGLTQSAVNVVLPQEVEENPNISEDHLAVYWRCVRSGKPDAGRPHRDSSFWDLEFSEGYKPKIPFEFSYLQDCKKIWIPIAGCNPDTTLRIIPGSHRMDIPTIVEQTEYGRRPTICPKWLQKESHLFMTPPELSQGNCILFDMNLVHVGPCHEQSTSRISSEFNFIAK
jgi:Phytanoyl-CoA dioxygenase (PhyH)